MHKALVILIVIASLVAALVWSLFALSGAKRDARRNAACYQSSLSLVNFYLTRDSLYAATQKAQYRTIAELENERQDLIQELDNAKIRLRNIENITHATTRTEYVVRLDTVYVTKHDTMQALSYSDKWLTATILGDTLSVVTRDSLTVFLHSRRRRFLFWTWNRYTGSATVVSKNPHTQIVNVETLTIEK